MTLIDDDATEVVPVNSWWHQCSAGDPGSDDALRVSCDEAGFDPGGIAPRIDDIRGDTLRYPLHRPARASKIMETPLEQASREPRPSCRPCGRGDGVLGLGGNEGSTGQRDGETLIRAYEHPC